jgi:(p)ppGpp synthase/HD superfamily hydrolase
METILQRVKEFADRAHGNQMRWYTSERYIVHPVRVMKICREYTSELPLLAAALLHDVLEDTPVRRNELEAFLLTLMPPDAATRTTLLVEDLTDVYIKSSYPGLNRRQRKKKEASRMENTEADAQTIKYADIIDNSTEMVKHDPAFAAIYLTESRDLLNRIPKGNQELYQRAISTVESCLTDASRHRRF